MARTNLIIDQPFFAALALKLVEVETRQVSTMATDGVSLFYNPDFVNKLPIRQIEAVICHEVMHCANGHVWRRGGRNPVKWNYACDYAINPMIIASNFKLPDGALNDAKYHNMPAEKIYNLLPDQQDDGDGGEGTGGVGIDSDGDSSGNGNQQGRGPSKHAGDCDHDFGPNHNPSLDVLDAPRDKAGEIEADWKLSTLQAAKAAKAQGKLPAGLEREVMETVRPKVDWRSLMRRFVQETARNDYSWKNPSARYAALGLYLPCIRSEQMPPIVVAIDTSGSIGSNELQAFRSELQAIIDELQPSEVTVLYADAAVARVDRFHQGEPLVFHPAGGGGTDFRPVFNWVEKDGMEPTCLVYITDMYGEFPRNAPGYPTLWLSTSDVVGPFGDTVRMDM